MDKIKYEVVEDSPFKFQPVSKSATSFSQTPSNKTPSSNSGLSMSNEQALFEAKVKDYISKNKPKIYILTPCYGGVCYTNYVSCLMNTLNVFKQLDVDIQVEFCKNDSLVPRARNNLVAKAMSDPKMTHVIFIDGDISWDPMSIFKLLIADKHVVGGVYPLKHYHWDKLTKDPLNPYKSNIVQSWIDHKNTTQLKDTVSDEVFIQNKLVTYNINYLDSYLNISDNLAKVKHTATGFLMIQRNVFENMFKAFPSTKYVDDVHFLQSHENEFAYALFDCGVEEGHYYSEDWLFCHRWSKMGGDIYIDVSINLNHTGPEDFKGSYITSII